MLSHSFSLCSSSSHGSLSDSNTLLISHPLHISLTLANGAETQSMTTITRPISSGGAVNCASLHLGEIRPGTSRGNHRHYTCNETFVIWGAKTIFRVENHAIDRGYAEVTIGADEVAVATGPHGTAHALINVDPQQSTFFIGCQDRIIDYSNSSSDFNVWKDL